MRLLFVIRNGHPGLVGYLGYVPLVHTLSVVVTSSPVVIVTDSVTVSHGVVIVILSVGVVIVVDGSMGVTRAVTVTFY